LTAAVISFRPKRVLRDVGKALSIDLAMIDQLAKSHHWWDEKEIRKQSPIECGLDPESGTVQMWINLAAQLIVFPRHLSKHPGGSVIARCKLSPLVPIENAAIAARSMVQWDKDYLDALRLLKVGILALGMSSALRRTLDLISEQRGELFELQDIPAEDAATASTVHFLRFSDRSGHHSSRPNSRRNGASVSAPAARLGVGKLTEFGNGRSFITHAGRTNISGTSHAGGDSGRWLTPGEVDQLRRTTAAGKRKGGLDHF
jgi:hypothetical protein